jgi:hypothetical protein
LKNVVEKARINKIAVRFSIVFGLSGGGSAVVGLLEVGRGFEFVEKETTAFAHVILRVD